MSPYLTHSHGSENNIEKLIPISVAKNHPAYLTDNSPVVSGLALVLSTCLSISLSAKSLIMHPADLVVRAPTVKSDSIFKLGMRVGEPSAKPQ